MRLTVFFLLLVATTAKSQTQWKVIASPTKKNLNQVSFIDSVQGWVAGDTGTILHTSDGGNTWTAQNSGILDDIKWLFVLDNKYGWALALRYDIDSLWFGSILLRTSDGGASWIHQQYRDKFYYTVTFQDSANGWMGNSAGDLLKTSDSGVTWVPASVDSSIWAGYPILNFRFYSRMYGFAMGGHIDIAGVIWRTTDGGDRWAAGLAAGEPVRDLHFVDSLHIVAIGGDFENGPAMVLSRDGGQTWVEQYLTLIGEIRAMSFRTPSEGWVALGVLCRYMVTKDTGSTWTTLAVPDSGAVFDVMFTDSLHGYMVGTRGLVMKYRPTLAGSDPTRISGLAASFALSQNFPNPFNPSTTIRYFVPVRSQVRLEVYNGLGQRVAVVVDGVRRAGSYEEVWNPDLSSGVYFCRLETRALDETAGHYSQVRKMLLLR